MSERRKELPNYSDIRPPKIFRPVMMTPAMEMVDAQMGQLADEGIIRKKLSYRFDTLYDRETRQAARLGQAAVDKYIEALTRLAAPSWSQEVTAPVADIYSDAKRAGWRRIVIEVEESDELKEERQRALMITERMSGVHVPPLDFKRNITLGRLSARLSRQAVDTLIEDLELDSVTLLPNQIH